MLFNGKQPYQSAIYQIPREKLTQLSSLRPKESFTALLINWISLILLTQIGIHLTANAYFPIFYLPLSFLIAGRFGVFIQLAHEACHGVLMKNKKRASLVAKWLTCLPIGVFYDGYASGHLKHHTWAGTEKDPESDSEKYKIVDVTNPKLFFLFLKDFLGITALSVFFKYRDNEKSENPFQKLLPLCLVQGILFTLFFRWDIKSYLLFWIFPAISSHMVLMRVRGMAEHGLAKQIGKAVHEGSEGTFYTRSFLTPQRHYAFLPFTWLEKLLIGSLNVSYHHEHHLFPSVPYYHLPKLHELIANRVGVNNPYVYNRGYFSAAFQLPQKRLTYETV